MSTNDDRAKTEHVNSYMRFRYGKWEHVTDYYRSPRS